MKAIAWLGGLTTLVVAGAYTTVSLARWEWNRALFFGLLFLAAEVGLAAALVLRRLARVERSLADLRPPPSASPAHDALRRTRGQADRFPWLRVDPAEAVTRTNVFITLVVGGGILLSGGAWVLDKVAARTVDPGRERDLGRELDAIAYRPGLLVDDVTALARPRPERDDPRVRAFLREQP